MKKGKTSSRARGGSRFKAAFAAALLVAPALLSQEIPDGGEPSGFERASARMQARIDETVQAYREFQNAIGAERLELVSRVNELENRLVELRAETRESSLLAEEGQAELDEREKRLEAYDAQLQYVESVLAEYLDNFESRAHFAEDQLYFDDLAALREGLQSAESQSLEAFERYAEAFAIGLQRQRAHIGGRRFEGMAIASDGGVAPGQVVAIGPVAYFAAEGGGHAGALQFNSGAVEPRLEPMGAEAAPQIRQVAAEGSGLLPLDASLGKARALDRERGNVATHVAKGGWVGFGILALGGVALVVAGLKVADFRRFRLPDAFDVAAAARQAIARDAAACRKSVATAGVALGPVIQTGCDFIKCDTQTRLEAMSAAVARQRPRFERFLPLLATIAAVAPLMGLLGTVVGMIKTFTLITVFGTGDAKSLSSGISEALVTTELGLVVAIPALIAHGAFVRLSRGRIDDLEEVASAFSREAERAKLEEEPA